MRRLETLLPQLEAYVQEEIGAQGRMLVLLEAQERAILAGDPQALLERTQAVEAEITQVAQRAQRRTHLLDELSALWHVGRGTLTLSSIVERVGPAAERLDRQRVELRSATARVARKARRLGSAARMHMRLTSEAIELLLAGGEERSVREGGLLVDAEA